MGDTTRRDNKARAIFERKAERANKKIAALPRATGTPKIVPIPQGTETAAEHRAVQRERILNSKLATPRQKELQRRMNRRDI